MNWIDVAWQTITPAAIQDAFQCCGITEKGKPYIRSDLNSLLLKMLRHNDKYPIPCNFDELADGEGADGTYCRNAVTVRNA